MRYMPSNLAHTPFMYCAKPFGHLVAGFSTQLLPDTESRKSTYTYSLTDRIPAQHIAVTTVPTHNVTDQ